MRWVTSPITPPAPDPNPSIAKRKPVMLAAALAVILPVVGTVLGILDVNPEVLAAVAAVSAVVIGAVNKWAASQVYAEPTVTALLAAAPDRPPAPPPPTSLADVSAVATDIHHVTLAALAAPTPSNAEVLTAAIYSHRLAAWSTVYLHPESNPDEGTFVLTDATYAGLPVAQYVPGESATHTPIGPDEQARMGLRPIVRPPDAEGN